MADRDPSAPKDRAADLVLEGGGVKGIALVGAIDSLVEAGYRFPRVAGTSAGAVVGSVLAAMQLSGEDLGRLEDVALTLNYRKFRDRGLPGSLLGPLGFLVDGFSVLVSDGVFEGDYLSRWLRGVLADLEVRTFGDLRVSDPEGDGGIHHDYSLVVTASDISRKRLVHLPWDYSAYGLDPDEQSVAAAVRASSSIPFFFEPVTLSGPRGKSTLVDGGLLSNFPIAIFDRADENPPRWPTIGIRLGTLGIGEEPARVSPVRGPVALGIGLVETSIEACQAEHVLDPCNTARSVFVDTASVGTTDFTISRQEQNMLMDAGRAAGREFLPSWDFQGWLDACRAAVPGSG
ncbi:patatin-like phospholipase family protein [soil metagenome]